MVGHDFCTCCGATSGTTMYYGNVRTVEDERRDELHRKRRQRFEERLADWKAQAAFESMQRVRDLRLDAAQPVKVRWFGVPPVDVRCRSPTYRRGPAVAARPLPMAETFAMGGFTFCR